MEKDITLINPRHNLAPENGNGHIYLPTGLLTLASQIMHSGGEVEIIDQNYEPHNIRTNISTENIGIGLIGPPYIPESQELISRTGDKHQFILGGQAISSLSSNEFSQIYKNTSAIRETVQTSIQENLSLSSPLLPREDTSLVPGYELISDDLWKEYLHPSREISLYLSEGCHFECTFCAAEKDRPERYRNLIKVKADLEYLVKKSISLQYSHMNIYLSNLDTLQTPKKLYEFCELIQEIKNSNHEFTFSFRGLATLISGHNIFSTNREKFLPKSSFTGEDLLQKMKDIGFTSLGYGIDGFSKEVWKSTKKPNNARIAQSVIQKTFESGLIPESLMVFGHDADTEESMNDAVYTAKLFMDKYESIPRPHNAKKIPGSNEWKNPSFNAQRKFFLENPEYFFNLDFAALPSSLTHPDKIRREMIKKYYLEMCNIGGCSTKPVLPIEPFFSEKKRRMTMKKNEKRYDH